MSNSKIKNVNEIQIGGNFPLPAPKPIIPRKGNLDAGNYDSDIKKIEAVYDANGNIVAIDFFHELMRPDSSKILVRFRYYYPSEIPQILDIFASYGIQGSLENATGTKERIEVAEAENSSYMKISDRKLKPKTGGLLAARHKATSKPPSKATNLLDDEEEDRDSEFDDFLEDFGEEE